MNIENLLMENEQLLYSLFPNIKKLDNDKYAKKVLLVTLLSIMSFFFILCSIIGSDDGIMGTIVITTLCLLVLALPIISLVSEVNSRKKTLNEKYYITNKRVIKIVDNDYEELYISSIQDTKITDYKNGYGEIILSDCPINIDRNTLRNNAQYILNTYQNNKKIKLQALQNPNEILNRILEIKR